MIKAPFKLIIFALTVSMLGFLWWTKPTPPTETVFQAKTHPVNTYHLKKDNYPWVFKTYGSMVALNETYLKSPISSQIIQTHIKPGDTVKKSFRMVELDLTPLSIDIQSLQSELSKLSSQQQHHQDQSKNIKAQIKEQKTIQINAKKALQRLTQLDPKHRTLQEIEKAKDKAALENQKASQLQSQLNQTEHQIQTLQQNKKQTQLSIKKLQHQYNKSLIKAPYDGYITEVNVSNGDVISQNQSILTMIDPSSFQIKALIPDSYIQTLNKHLDKPKTIKAEASFLDQKYNLTFRSLQRDNNQTYGVHAFFNFQNKPQMLINDQIISLDIFVPNSKKIFRAPQDCFYRHDYIYVIQDNTLKELRIQRLGFTKDKHQDYIIFTHPDLNDNDTVLLTRLTNPSAKTKIMIQS